MGWKYFWFDFDSLLRDYSFGETLNLIFVKDRVDPEQSNLNFVLDEFLNNEIWFHGVVLFSLVETVLMALLGTMIASMIGLPLAFFAAANITPFAMVRFGLRRLFDCLRGIDTLIWSLVLLRAFGPGLFTGIFAIALTDIGTLGKLMSEAIENSESKQKEGVASTGASRLQQHRFGIREPDERAVFLQDGLHRPRRRRQSLLALLHVQDDSRAPFGGFGRPFPDRARRDGKLAIPRAGPLVRDAVAGV